MHPRNACCNRRLLGNHSRPAFGQTHAMSESFLLPFRVFLVCGSPIIFPIEGLALCDHPNHPLSTGYVPTQPLSLLIFHISFQLHFLIAIPLCSPKSISVSSNSSRLTHYFHSQRATLKSPLTLLDSLRSLDDHGPPYVWEPVPLFHSFILI